MLPNLPIAPPNLPARRQPQAPAEPVRARTGADLSARSGSRGAEPSFKELLRRDLSAAQRADRSAKPEELDGATSRGGSPGSAETSEVRATDDAAATVDAAIDATAGQDARTDAPADSSRDAGDAADDRSDGAATRDDADDRGQPADEGDDTQDASREVETAEAITTAVAAADTVAPRSLEVAAVEAGTVRAASSEPASAEATRREFGATLGTRLATGTDTAADTGPVTEVIAGRMPADTPGAAGPAVVSMERGRAQASGQQAASQRNSNDAGPTQPSPSPHAANAQNAAAAPVASPDATAATMAATTSPIAVSAAASNMTEVAAKSTETAAGPAVSATPDGVRVDSAGSATGAGADKASAAIRALEDAVLAARADRASSPSDAASRAADPALARVAAMEADLAAERVAQALGQGLVEFEAVDASARATADATIPEKRPSANTTLGADARAMAEAMAADRAGSSSAAASTAMSGSNASTHSAAALPTAGAPLSAASGMAPLGGMLGAGGPAADLARQPSDGGTPAAQLAAKGLGILANQRGGAITMRLEPPALGQLRIELQVSQGAVVADFTAATAEARALLEANLGMLRERLESQGLSVERITIHGARTAEAATQSSGDQRQEQGGNADARDRGGERRQDAAGGESRGRRDRDPSNQHELAGRANRRQGGFASALDSASMTPPARRSA